jgi:hypothetical protein
VIASIRPENPPKVNKTTKAHANNIGVSNVIEPLNIVAIQLKTLTPVGTAISIVAHMKNSSAAKGIPTVNIWCAQTTNDRIAIDSIAHTIEEYPKSCFLENVSIM